MILDFAFVIRDGGRGRTQSSSTRLGASGGIFGGSFGAWGSRGAAGAAVGQRWGAVGQRRGVGEIGGSFGVTPPTAPGTPPVPR